MNNMYILQEIQTTDGNTALVPAKVFSDRKQAESAFHMALGAAAISEVQIHSVVLMNEHGAIVRSEFYEHFPSNLTVLTQQEAGE